MVLLIVSLVCLFQMHRKNSKSDDFIKTFGLMDIICAYAFMFFVYTVSLFFIYPQAKNNVAKELSGKDGTIILALLIGILVSGIISIFHMIIHFIRLKKAELPLISTSIKHFLMGLTFLISIPIYYFFIDDSGKITNWQSEGRYASWGSGYTPSSNHDDFNDTYNYYPKESTYYDQYGNKLGKSYTDSYGDSSYYDQYGNKTGTSHTNSYGETTYYDQYGYKTGTSQKNSFGETTYYDNFGNKAGSSQTDSFGDTTYKN